MDHRKNLETCLVIVTGLLIIFLIKDWKPLLIAAVIIGFTGVFLERPASWITWLWYKIADILGKIVPKVILSLVFYLFLFPISVLSRMFRRSSLGVNEGNRNSIWINREHTFSKDDLIKPW
jgi:hypothetical protein